MSGTEQGAPTVVQVPFEDLRALFDMVCNSLDFGSGSLESDDVTVLRRLAVTIGVDPILATPVAFGKQYPHRYQGVDYWPHCNRCYGAPDDPIHTAAPETVVPAR